MTISGMRFAEHQPPATIDVNEFYDALVEAHKIKKSVTVKPHRPRNPEVVTAPEYIRDREKNKEQYLAADAEIRACEIVRQRSNPVLDSPLAQGAHLGPEKLASRYPELADPRTDFLLYGVGGHGLFDDVEKVKDLDAIKATLVELSDRIANL